MEASCSNASGDRKRKLSSDSTSYELENKIPLQCHSCSKLCSTEELFRCQSDVCSKKSAVDDSEIANQLFYCKMCIIFHLRKKHEIIDHRGYTPAICEEHENLVQYFCVECSVVFCSDCIVKHSNHSFEPVSERASKVRKSVFGLMEKYETLSKPIKHQEDVVKNGANFISRWSRPLSREKLTETLRKVYESVIASNVWDKYAPQSCDEPISNCSDLLEIVSQGENNATLLKNLLGMSDGQCVKNFVVSESNFETSVSKQKKELEKHIFLEWTSNLESIVKSSIRTAARKIKLPKMKKVDFEVVSIGSRRTAVPNSQRHEIDSEDAKSNVQDTLSSPQWTYLDFAADLLVGEDTFEVSIAHCKLVVQNMQISNTGASNSLYSMGTSSSQVDLLETVISRSRGGTGASSSQGGTISIGTSGSQSSLLGTSTSRSRSGTGASSSQGGLFSDITSSSSTALFETGISRSRGGTGASSSQGGTISIGTSGSQSSLLGTSTSRSRSGTGASSSQGGLISEITSSSSTALFETGISRSRGGTGASSSQGGTISIGTSGSQSSLLGTSTSRSRSGTGASSSQGGLISEITSSSSTALFETGISRSRGGTGASSSQAGTISIGTSGSQSSLLGTSTSRSRSGTGASSSQGGLISEITSSSSTALFETGISRSRGGTGASSFQGGPISMGTSSSQGQIGAGTSRSRSGTGTSFSQMEVQNSVTETLIIGLKFWNCPAKRCFVSKQRVAICLNNNQVMIYNTELKKFVCNFFLRESQIPLDLLVLQKPWNPPDFLYRPVTTWLVFWNSEESIAQRMENDGSEKTICTLTEKPKLTSCYSEARLCFVDPLNNVTVYDSTTEDKLEILNIHHGLKSVDRVKFKSAESLFLFNYKDLIILEFKIEINRFSLLRMLECFAGAIYKLDWNRSFPVLYIDFITDEIIGIYKDEDGNYKIFQRENE